MSCEMPLANLYCNIIPAYHNLWAGHMLLTDGSVMQKSETLLFHTMGLYQYLAREEGWRDGM
jgi:hypothetical protein